MKSQWLLSTAFLTLSAVLSAPTLACSSGDYGGLISDTLQLGVINNLGCGKYEFAGVNSDYDSWFSNRWKLYASEDMTVSLSVFDMELDLDESNKNFDTAKIFDTKNMSFTLWDEYSGKFLGWAGENETLSGLSLQAGRWYTLKVYGNVGGLFGSAYHGILSTEVAAVPLGDTAPLLGSALALLALQGSIRRRPVRSIHTAAR